MIILLEWSAGESTSRCVMVDVDVDLGFYFPRYYRAPIKILLLKTVASGTRLHNPTLNFIFVFPLLSFTIIKILQTVWTSD